MSTAALDLSLLVTKLFAPSSGASYSDIYIQPGLPVRARVSSSDWVVVDDPDHAGKPVVLTESQFGEAMGGFFSSTPNKPDPKWKERVKEGNGCIYPMFPMEVEVVDANGKSTSTIYRIRGTLQSQHMGSSFGLMLRCLREVPTSLGVLGLPQTLDAMTQARSGLILVTGPTGSGKTSTIAAIVNVINSSRAANIVTIEDPVEYIHSPKMGTVAHREIGVDVSTYAAAVEQVLRFVPDVIVIGEIRDADTMRAAVRAGESGHLVLGTLHAPTAIGAIRKGLGYLDAPGEKIAFGSCLVGVIAQALVPAKDKSKALAYEILDCLTTDGSEMTVAKSVEEMVSGKQDSLAALEKSFESGKLKGFSTSPFSNSLKDLVKRGKVEPQRAAAIVAGDRDLVKELMALGRPAPSPARTR